MAAAAATGPTPEPRQQRVGGRSVRRSALALAVLLLLGGCAEEPLPQQRLRSDDCLKDVRLDQLAAQIQRCDAVVAAFPGRPEPLNDRYLLHSLAGNEVAACQDINRAAAVARSRASAELDAQLRAELKLRQELCRKPSL